MLEDIQTSIHQRALQFREAHSHRADTYDELKQRLEEGGFVWAHWDGTDETEAKIKEETKATIRCIPLNAEAEEGVCVYSGQPSHQRVVFAKAY